MDQHAHHRPPMYSSAFSTECSGHWYTPSLQPPAMLAHM
eukprot:CAMPEP_0202859880 /NCGR_PEP_ID=MMETSP1391-20130828/1818_1 /ASSEMBLY_ACC=CAM_ASM_000867 /TAXON_ID=1034604 /ORGANISM="Chlamydomonas leiostraca, Strain SAG 11-49" /LENGTH=38 /DNA_ID= /DNA_START= /DNA_END= /DNA_ORIENTATION=